MSNWAEFKSADGIRRAFNLALATEIREYEKGVSTWIGFDHGNATVVAEPFDSVIKKAGIVKRTAGTL